MKTCRFCDKPAKGKQYVTIKVEGSTIRTEGLRLCSEHGEDLKERLQYVLLEYLGGAYLL